MKSYNQKVRALVVAAFAAGTLLTAGCEQNLLDQPNPNLPTTATFWKTGDDAVRGVNAAYAGLQGVGLYRRGLHFAYDARSDDGLSRSPATGLREFTGFIINNFNLFESSSIYIDSYRTITRCNQVLDNVPNISMEAGLKSRVLAEARFIRALSYFNLVSLYGNVPLSTQTPTLDYRPKQGTEAEVWSLVISDLKEAIGTGTALPASNAAAADRGRVTVGAARALLGKAYMQNKRWQEAADQFALVTGYTLATNYRENFRHSTNNNVESVFEVQFLDNNIDGPDGFGGVGANTAQGFQRPKFFGPPQNRGTANLGFTDAELQPWVVQEFLQEGTVSGQRDPRLAATTFYNYGNPVFASALPLSGDSLVYDQSRPPGVAAGTYGFRNRYRGDRFNLGRTYWRKYQSDYYRGDENFNSPTNFRVIRYADVLLLRAEALNELKRPADAVPLINQVRRRAGLAELRAGDFNEMTMRAQLRHERVTELTGECLRWFDLQRYGLLNDAAGVAELRTRDEQFNNFVVGRSRLLPLPQSEVDIAGLTQNPNY